MASSVKCDDCKKHAGLFQCCHCQQRLCIRCCNRHYRKVTLELEHLHESSDRLMTKIVRTKSDLERKKNEIIEQCHQWRIDTMNSINRAHTLIIQTIHHEYELLSKEYELFVDQEMLLINIDRRELSRMKKKGTLGSLLSTLSSNTNLSQSFGTIKARIEAVADRIDRTGLRYFNVHLPAFHIDETLRVESQLGDTVRSTSALSQTDGHLNPTVPIVDERTCATDSSSDPQTAPGLSAVTDSPPSEANVAQHRCVPSPSVDETFDDHSKEQLKSAQKNLLDGITNHVARHQNIVEGSIDRRRACTQVRRLRRRSTMVLSRSPSLSSAIDRLPNQSWLYYRAGLVSLPLQ